MAPLKKLPQTEEDVLIQGYQLIHNFQVFRKRRRTKKKVNLASDKIVVVSARATRNPVSEKNMISPATSEQVGVRAKKSKLYHTNWGID